MLGMHAECRIAGLSLQQPCGCRKPVVLAGLSIRLVHPQRSAAMLDTTQMAAIALRVACITSSGAVQQASCTIASMAVGHGSVGYQRPLSSALQHMAHGQTRVEVPGADGLLVAGAPLIRQHIAKAIELASPFVTVAERVSRPDLVEAVRYVSSFGSDGAALVADRMARLDAFESLVTSMADAQRRLGELRSRECRACQCADISIPLVHACIDGLGWPDVGFAASLVHGFPSVGEYGDTGVFRAKECAAELNFGALDHNYHLNELELRLARDARVAQTDPARRRVLEVLTSKTRKEVLKGLSEGPLTRLEVNVRLGKSCWRALHAFGVEQGYEDDGVTCKIRRCDNAKASGTNRCLYTHETIACEDASFPVLVASLFSEIYHGPIPPLHHSTDDVESAYRRMGCAHPETTVVALWDTELEAVAYYTMPGHNFGLKAAVLSFNRYSQLIAAVARRVFGVCCCAYFDDYDCTEPTWALDSGKVVLRRLSRWFGVPLVGGDKDVAPRPANPFLGVITDFSRVAEGLVTVRAKPERIVRLVLSIEQFLAQGWVEPAERKTFFGKLEYISHSTSAHRLGSAALAALRAWDQASSGSEPLSAMAVDALLFLLFLLPRLAPRVFKLRGARDVRAPIIVYTDAMYVHGAKVPSRVGVVIYDPEDQESKSQVAPLVAGDHRRPA